MFCRLWRDAAACRHAAVSAAIAPHAIRLAMPMLRYAAAIAGYVDATCFIRHICQRLCCLMAMAFVYVVDTLRATRRLPMLSLAADDMLATLLMLRHMLLYAICRYVLPYATFRCHALFFRAISRR